MASKKQGGGVGNRVSKVASRVCTTWPNFLPLGSSSWMVYYFPVLWSGEVALLEAHYGREV